MSAHAEGNLTSFTEIPVIDVSPLWTGGPDERLHVAGKISKAAGEVGFFRIINAPISRMAEQGLEDAARSFFARPTNEKMTGYIGQSGVVLRGYVPVGEELASLEDASNAHPDLKEAFDAGVEVPSDDPLVLAGVPMIGPNNWPELPGFGEAVTAYLDEAMQVADRLWWAFAVGLGQDPAVFTHSETRSPTVLRLSYFPPDREGTDRPGLGEHTDIECFVLLKSDAPGLEVLNGAGEWIDVPPLPHSFMINIGDLLEIWTNGRYVATTHRVRAVECERYSFPLFVAPEWDTEVKPLPQFLSDTTKTMPSVRAGEHMWGVQMQMFGYLREMVIAGTLALPEDAVPIGYFGRKETSS